MFTVEAAHKKEHQVSEMLIVSSYASLHLQRKQCNLQTSIHLPGSWMPEAESGYFQIVSYYAYDKLKSFESVDFLLKIKDSIERKIHLPHQMCQRVMSARQGRYHPKMKAPTQTTTRLHSSVARQRFGFLAMREQYLILDTIQSSVSDLL